jgi:hypothetical protein
VGTAPSARPYISYRVEGGAHGQIYQSTDGGTTWRPLGDAPHSPSVAAILCLSPAPDAAGNLLVGTDLGEVWHVARCDVEIAETVRTSGLDEERRRRVRDATAVFERLRSVAELERIRDLTRDP